MDGFYHRDERDRAVEDGGLGCLVALVLLLAAIVGCIIHLVATTQEAPTVEPSLPEMMVVHDTMDNSAMRDADEQIIGVPVYLQTDERWGGFPYATFEGTVHTHGCGLTCAAMAFSYFEHEETTPAELLNMVGNTCVDEWAGVNDMTKFCEWMHAQDQTLVYTVIYDDMGRALDDLHYGRLVFASMAGELVPGGNSYGGHIVLLCGVTPTQRITVRDPYDGGVSEGGMSMEEFMAVDWDYFISIGRE